MILTTKGHWESKLYEFQMLGFGFRESLQPREQHKLVPPIVEPDLPWSCQFDPRSWCHFWPTKNAGVWNNLQKIIRSNFTDQSILEQKRSIKKNTTTFNISIYKTNNWSYIMISRYYFRLSLPTCPPKPLFLRAVIRLFGRPGKDALPNNQRLVSGTMGFPTGSLLFRGYSPEEN